MNKILDMMERELKRAFTASGYEDSFAKVVLSNRPDLCEYQCNGAMAAAKKYKKKPIDIANEVVEKASANPVFSEITAVMPGFINIRLNGRSRCMWDISALPSSARASSAWENSWATM